MRGGLEALWFRGKHGLLVLTDMQCALFDARSHQELLHPAKVPLGTQHYSVSSDGGRVAFATPEGLAGVWSLETGELLLPPCLRDHQLTDVNFSPDDSQLLATSLDGTAMLLRSSLTRETASHRFDAAMANDSPKPLLEWHRFSPGRRHFLLILMDGAVRLVDFEQMTDQRIPADQFKGLWPVQVTFDISGGRGAIYYSKGDTHLVEIWTEDEHMANRFVLPHPADLSDKLLFTPDGSRLLTPARDGQIRVWRTADGTLERSIQAQGLVHPVLFPDGRTVFGVSTKTNGFALLDLAGGSITEAPLPPFEITAFLFNSTGDRFATAGKVSWSRVWDARTGEPLTQPLEHGGEVRWVDWSPDGRRILTAGLTPEVKVWDASTGEQLLAPLVLGAKPLETAQWSLDGRFIVARSDENTVRVWDAATGEPITPVLHHSSYVRLAQLVANNRLVTLSMPDLMRAWDLIETHLPVDVIADYAKLASGRRFNATGVTVPTKPSELADLCRSLHARAPELFQ
jgi:WD40 repeat protein